MKILAQAPFCRYDTMHRISREGSGISYSWPLMQRYNCAPAQASASVCRPRILKTRLHLLFKTTENTFCQETATAMMEHREVKSI